MFFLYALLGKNSLRMSNESLAIDLKQYFPFVGTIGWCG